MLAAKQEIRRIIRTKSWSLHICVSLGKSRSRGNPHKCGSLNNPGIRLADGFISVGCPSNLSFTHIILKTSTEGIHLPVVTTVSSPIVFALTVCT